MACERVRVHKMRVLPEKKSGIQTRSVDVDCGTVRVPLYFHNIRQSKDHESVLHVYVFEREGYLQDFKFWVKLSLQLKVFLSWDGTTLVILKFPTLPLSSPSPQLSSLCTFELTLFYSPLHICTSTHPLSFSSSVGRKKKDPAFEKQSQTVR